VTWPLPSPHSDLLAALSNLLVISADDRLSAYLLPFAVAAATVLFVIWRLHRKDVALLTAELEHTRSLAQEREQERDLAQDELFRRLYEERELNKDKVQFQSQLAEYEKYAALAQLALGAAHEAKLPADRRTVVVEVDLDRDPGAEAGVQPTSATTEEPKKKKGFFGKITGIFKDDKPSNPPPPKPADSGGTSPQ